MFEENYNLGPHNTLGFEAQSRYFTRFETEAELRYLLSKRPQNLPLRILGGGSNVLLSKDFEGLTLQNGILGRALLEETPQKALFLFGGGEVWADAVAWTLNQGYGGLENLSLIPGTVGAAPIQNIGAYGLELAERFVYLDALNIETLETQRFNKEACQFAYRDSFFKQEGNKGKFVILRVALQLYPAKQSPLLLDYAPIAPMLQDLGLEANPKNIAQAIIAIRESKLPDPKKIGNAGSFFKNPSIDQSQAQALQAQFPQLKLYPSEQANCLKVPAGFLIEQAGWKGKRLGQVGVHEKQALVLVHFGQGKGQELLQLSQEIQADVLKKFGVALEAEVNIW